MFQVEENRPNFKGSLAYVSIQKDSLSRPSLPFFRDENEKLDMLKVLFKLIGQDITKVSLPVILSEPLTILQRQAENINYDNSMLV